MRALAKTQRRLGETLQALRLARGWSQEQAAEVIGISDKQLRRAELGRANITLATVVALSAGYRVSVAALFQDLEA